jgi:L-methionine (R)-S-oxide reductase
MKKLEFLETAQALLESQPNQLAMLSNASAFLYETFDRINWVGFYLYDSKVLTVGPFQGKVACSVIPLGKGVCGEAAETKKTMVVKDVHAHPNHIACDANSRSEVVVPIFIKNKLFGVLDVDSPVENRFDPEIVSFLEDFVALLVKTIDK